MKKLVGIVLIAVLVAGCASVRPKGYLYTNLTLPDNVGDQDLSGAKVGVSECMSILSLVAMGDAGINAAMENGGVKQVKYIDWHGDSILGLIGNYSCTVYGD